ncbi:MAG: hypothetical protein SFV21_01250 [Rhodospirillaceae bacterium]|nr:hypothetical protein [Rhodospirillaceae bacterium]
MLFRSSTLSGIKSGAITLAFRRWDAPRAKPGGRQKTRIGVVAITSVTTVGAADITAAAARSAGFATRTELLAELNARGGGQIYRIGVSFAGADPRIALRRRAKLSADELADVVARLARLDRASPAGPWTRTFLALIAARPATRAVDIARLIGWQRAPFKINVRKLKALGLTESLEIGYRLSPRGKAVLKAMRSGSATARSSRRRP